MDLTEQASSIQDRADLVAFVRALAASLAREPEARENCDVPTYLDALAAWIEDMDGYYANADQPVPAKPDWGTLGQALLAAGVYE